MGSLWGTYDEAANAASFKDAVASWRSGEPAASSELPPPPGMSAAPAPAPAPAPAARTVAAACYECMRRFTSAGVQCPQTGKRFCSASCFDTYSQSAGGQAALNAAINKQTEPSVAAMGQAQAALPKRALAMPIGKDKLGRSSLDQLRMRLSRGGGRSGARGPGRRGRAGRSGAQRDQYEAGRQAVTASFVAAENAAKQAGSAAAARAGVLQQQQQQQPAVTFADSTGTGGASRDSEMNGTGGGGSLWGTYDEAANAASFKDAVAAFRSGGAEDPAMEPEQQSPASSSPVLDTPKVAVPKSSCYGCFKLFPTASAVTVGGRAFCSDACAPTTAPTTQTASAGATATDQSSATEAAVAKSATAAVHTSSPESSSDLAAASDVGTRRPPPAGERWCARDGCDRSFVSWKGVAVVTADQGALVFCSESCCPNDV